MTNDYLNFVASLESVKTRVPAEVAPRITMLLRRIEAFSTTMKKLKGEIFYREDDNGVELLPVDGMRLLHAIIGKFDELGELISTFNTYQAGGGLDTKNLIEELGDDAFYSALAMLAIGVTPEQVEAANRAKLMRRYPNGFSKKDSDNRDYAKEGEAMDTALELLEEE